MRTTVAKFLFWGMVGVLGVSVIVSPAQAQPLMLECKAEGYYHTIVLKGENGLIFDELSSSLMAEQFDIKEERQANGTSIRFSYKKSIHTIQRLDRGENFLEIRSMKDPNHKITYALKCRAL